MNSTKLFQIELCPIGDDRVTILTDCKSKWLEDEGSGEETHGEARCWSHDGSGCEEDTKRRERKGYEESKWAQQPTRTKGG